VPATHVKNNELHSARRLNLQNLEAYEQQLLDALKTAQGRGARGLTEQQVGGAVIHVSWLLVSCHVPTPAPAAA
jgi:hypothetical protein